MAAVAFIRTQNKAFKRLFFLENSKVQELNKFSVPKLELKAAGLGTRLRTLIQAEITLKIEKVYLWTVSRVVLDWTSSTEKQNIFLSNRMEEIKLEKETKTDESNHVPTNITPADHGARGFEPSEISLKRLTAPQLLQFTESCWQDIKKISTVGAVTRN